MLRRGGDASRRDEDAGRTGDNEGAGSRVEELAIFGSVRDFPFWKTNRMSSSESENARSCSALLGTSERVSLCGIEWCQENREKFLKFYNKK
jgi:hypothetical protein